jgi:PucR family transcriptional regulator, purine catabolism regulatory protein
VFRILYLLPQQAEVCQFKEVILGPLLQYEAQHDIPLLETLTAFFEANCNVRETAKRLFTHYNTVVYRLQKIRSLLSADLDDAEFRLECQLALKLKMMEDVP